MKHFIPLLVVLPLLAALSACGLQPLYSGGTRSTVAQTLAGVEVAPIDGGKAGWLVRNALNDRLSAMRGAAAAPQYRLQVKLDDNIQGFGVRTDDSITRERRTLRARYQLVDTATGTQMLDATASADAGIDVVSSEYATIAAEDQALEYISQALADQILARLSLLARREATK